MKTDKDTSKNGETGNNYSELSESENPSPIKISKKENRKGNKEVKESRILRRRNTLKDKKDPDRFCGEGINFKAKIIGTEHVLDARGNRMCQGALQRLKAAVKTSGDHKQRIILNISYNGIIIKDEKSGEILHHHPIHKISFISQDTVDKRSFGYVFGCPQSGHEFFGIKTEKIASHVVLTLRDLFLAALEMKKKEIESAKESKKETTHQPSPAKPTTNGNAKGFEKDAVNGAHSQNELIYSNRVLLPDENVPPEATAHDLLDLQFSMDNLQMGISHMDHSIATAASQGFSFSEDDISESSSASFPMAAFKLDKFNPLCHETQSVSSRSSSTSDYNVHPNNEIKIVEEEIDSYSAGGSAFVMPKIPCSKKPSSPLKEKSASFEALERSDKTAVEDKYAVFQDIDALPSIFDNPISVSNFKGELTSCESVVFENDLPKKVAVEESFLLSAEANNPEKDQRNSEDLTSLDIFSPLSSKNSVKAVPVVDSLNFKGEPTSCESVVFENGLPKESLEKGEIKTSTPIVFAELDPLGDHPIVDKRYFFQDIKNPPKKVLKDLVAGEESSLLSAEANNTEYVQRNSKDPTSLDVFSPSWSKDSVEAVLVVDSLNLSDHKQASSLTMCPIPPKLPPKRAITSIASDSFSNKDDRNWETKNPFNPFVDDDFPNIPPPNSPPPPPPPRLPSKASEAPPIASPPPPRPPSRSSAIPTPPLPKRKTQLSSTCNTWFSFDQEAINSPPVLSTSNVDDVPPLPSPARKFPSYVPESPSIGSAPNNSATTSRHSLLSNQVNESDILPNNSFCEAHHSSSTVLEESTMLFSGALRSVEASPPLPPKPSTAVRLSPSKFSPMNSSSLSDTTVGSSNEAPSSSSLAFSSADENTKMGSSAEALFNSSNENHSTDVFFASEQSSTSEPAKELSPDSIFRRKSDPFADDFFLSLSRKSNDRQKSSNNVDLHFESLEAST